MRTGTARFEEYPPGFVPGKLDVGLQTNLSGGKRTGQNVSDLTYKPLIAGGERQAVQDVNLRMEPKIVAAKGQAEAEQERAFSMSGIGDLIQSAKDILSGESGVKPTGSGAGTVYDIAAGFVGKSPSGAAEAQKLKAIGGALTAKMPRMQGPQSDKDVILYKEMAATVGDSTVPIDRRLAALQTVEELWAKYERPDTKPSLPSGVSQELWDVMTPEERAAFK